MVGQQEMDVSWALAMRTSSPLIATTALGVMLAERSSIGELGYPWGSRAVMLSLDFRWKCRCALSRRVDGATDGQ